MRKTLLEKYPLILKRSLWYEEKGRIYLSYCTSGKRPSLLTLKDSKKNLWLALKEERPLSQIKKRLKESSSEFLKDIDYFLKKGLITLKKMPSLAQDRKSFYYLNIAHTIQKEFLSSKNLKEAEEDSKIYHLNQIKNPYHQFERIETTVSHIFSKRHPLLGKPYGVKIKEAIEKRKPLFKKAKVLEIGAGMGWLAKRFLDDLKIKKPSVYEGLNYIFLDLSWTLLKHQRRLNSSHKNTSFIQAHAEQLPFKDSSFDYLIANEIIADFRVVKLKKTKLKNLSLSQKEAWQLIKKYKLSLEDAPPEFVFSLGVIKFLEEAKRILKPSGLLLLIEYGSDWSYPTTVPLKGHKEHSIHFGLLAKVAQGLGFKVEKDVLLNFLGFKGNLKVISKCSHCLLKRLLNRKSLSPFLTKNMLKKVLTKNYCKFQNIQFDRLKDGLAMFDLQNFKVMVLIK